MKTRVAIACQGGGSETAFTAGVLKALLEKNKLRDHFEVASMSGTSGGALCAFLSWYAYKKGDDCLWKRLIDFWEDNKAQTPQERLFNDFVIQMTKLTSQGVIPQFNLSPSNPMVQTWFSLATMGLRSRYSHFEELLAAHIDFSEVKAWGAQPEPPVVVLGACNIITGRLHKFCSAFEAIEMEHLRASACVPNIFPAVTIGPMAYWDGLFSENPPITPLINREYVGVKNIAQEIWVIKIDRTTDNKIPTAPDEILDRRKQVESNVSLFQGIREIKDINTLMLRGAFRDEFLAEVDIKEPIKFPKMFPEDADQPYHIPMIEMSEELSKTLTWEDKLNRSPENIDRLIQDGEKQGKKFIEARLRQMG